jgi:BCD family chlorophyll transporter-like MFS transporter
VVTITLNGIALWKQESRHSKHPEVTATPPTFRGSWEAFVSGGSAVRRLVVVGLGTLGFSMEDVLLEPYGGQVLHLMVSTTTKLTATWALGGLLGFALASRVLARGFSPFRMATYGALVGIPAFAAVIASAPLGNVGLFAVGTLLIGFGFGLFSHGTLTATMNTAPKNQTGLALGAWGAVTATSAGVGVALGGVIRDLIAGTDTQAMLGRATGYTFVYGLEIVLLFAALITMLPLLRRAPAFAAGD